jgi:hypothetical protein
MTEEPVNHFMSVGYQHIANSLQEVLDQQHPCDAKQYGLRAVEELRRMILRMEKLQGHLETATESLLRTSPKAAIGLAHSGKNVWYDWEIPILYHPQLGIPFDVSWLKDDEPNSLWIRIGTQDRWRHITQSDDEVKSGDGYFTAHEILDNARNLVKVAQQGPAFAPIVFIDEDDQPDECDFPVLETMDLSTRFRFYWNFEKGMYICPDASDILNSHFGTGTPTFDQILEKTRLREVPQ